MIENTSSEVKRDFPKQKSGFNIYSKFTRSTAGVVFLVILALSIGVHFFTGNFFTVYNIGTLVRQVSFLILVSFGQTLVLILGGIDLSVASIAGLSSMVVALLMTTTGIPPFLCIIIALALGLVLGAINGLFIKWLNLSPLIVTLAAGAIYQGIIYVVTKGMPIVGIPESVTTIGQGELFGTIPYPTIIMLVIGGVLIIMMHYTSFGRHIFAVGGNEHAANIIGINVGRVKIMVYALSGLLASSAGVLMVLRLATSQVNIGENWVMPSITAAILGGTSMSGGSGSIVGTIVGGLLIGVISVSVTLVGVSSYWETIVTGGVILAAVVFDAIRRRKHGN
ncbi:ABC transporter permease [Neobacillus sp. MM2021_6]|uniref:ABC transporter permease n=1 Tax=Bacillaceae TaxID=186817 RepID=UPI00140CB282|nr:MULTISPECIES: ABC transporter permease [Bacillaceae]MBO0958663.1 ABC transporter permease [Neobacillus sp. MM2021_6]NHC20197.1 ABC transporter permease [Bacillus sp. MM2020_4]